VRTWGLRLRDKVKGCGFRVSCVESPLRAGGLHLCICAVCAVFARAALYPTSGPLLSRGHLALSEYNWARYQKRKPSLFLDAVLGMGSMARRGGHTQS